MLKPAAKKVNGLADFSVAFRPVKAGRKVKRAVGMVAEERGRIAAAVPKCGATASAAAPA